MKKRYALALFLLVFGYNSMAAGVGPLRLDTKKPQAGQPIGFEYTTGPGQGKLIGVKEIHAAVFFYTATKGTGYYAAECTIDAAGPQKWKGRFTLPDSAIAFAIRLRSGKLTEDNGGLGLIYPVYEKAGARTGAYAGTALLYANGERLLGTGNNMDTAFRLLQQELSLHPDLRSQYEGTWYTLLFNTKKQDAAAEIDRRLAVILSQEKPTEAEYKLAVRLYQLEKKKSAADSVLRIAAANYPSGELAVQFADVSFYKIRDIDSLVDVYLDFRKRFLRPAAAATALETANYFASTLSTRYIQKKEYQKAIGYASQMSDEMTDYRGFMYSWIALELIRADSALNVADSLIQTAIAGLETALAHPEKYKRKEATLYDWKNDLDRYYYAAFEDSYARLLAKKGEDQKAVEMQGESVRRSNEENNGFNEHYIKYLIKSGHPETARERAIAYIRKNNASDSVKIWFRDLYVKEHGSDKDYERFIGSLESDGLAAFRQEAIKERLDLPMKPFALQGLDGKEVSLAALKGKVVVMDFWATWCGPCKASFPAMQMAVDKFQKDTNVVFLFIDTWETMEKDSRVAAVSKFIQDNKYRFHVLLDQPVDQERKQYSVVSEYGVNGIPAKFILGPDGKILFKAAGFDGNNEKLVNELSVYIDLAKR